MASTRCSLGSAPCRPICCESPALPSPKSVLLDSDLVWLCRTSHLALSSHPVWDNICFCLIFDWPVLIVAQLSVPGWQKCNPTWSSTVASQQLSCAFWEAHLFNTGVRSGYVFISSNQSSHSPLCLSRCFLMLLAIYLTVPFSVNARDHCAGKSWEISGYRNIHTNPVWYHQSWHDQSHRDDHFFPVLMVGYHY